MKGFLNKVFLKNVSIFIIIVISITYNLLLDNNLECTCNDVSKDCRDYMALPFSIFFLLVLWTDKEFSSSCRYAAIRLLSSCRYAARRLLSSCRYAARRLCKCLSGCRKTKSKGETKEPEKTEMLAGGATRTKKSEDPHCCQNPLWGITGIILLHMLKAAVVGGMWVITVLMDGDWYVCCMNSNQTKLACKDKPSLTDDEKENIAKLKNKSRIIALHALLTVVGLAALLSACNWRGFCKAICDYCISKCCHITECGCCAGRVVYDELVLKESEDVLMEVLSNAAKTEMKNKFEKKIKKNKWPKCSHVVQEIIDDPTKTKKKDEKGTNTDGGKGDGAKKKKGSIYYLNVLVPVKKHRVEGGQKK